MAGIQMGGLASGLDTTSIISQLMAVERMPRYRIERQQAAAQARQDALRDIVTKLKALKQSATELQRTSLWTEKQTVTSDDTTRVGVRTTGTVAAGTYDVEVTRLANRAEQTWDFKQRPTDSVLSVTDSAGAVHDVTIRANATVDDAVASINAASGYPVTAVNRNGQLVLQAVATGAPGNFTASGQVLDTMRASVAGVDANYTVNGTAYTSSSNVTTTGIAGAELTLSALTAAGDPVRITATQSAVDRDAVVAKVKGFVDAYNAVADTIRGKLSEKRVPNATTTVDAKKGVLFADPGLSQTLSSLRIGVMDPLSIGNPATLDELAEIGISTGAASAMTAEKNNGHLVFDEAKFKAAWDGDQAAVERLLTGDGTVGGFAQRLDGLIKPLTEAGGLYDGRINAAGGELARLKDSLACMDLRLERKELFYRRQFTALEAALQKMQSQSVDLASRLPRANAS